MEIEDQLNAPLGMNLEAADYKSENIESRIAELKQKLDNQCKDFPILLKKIHAQVQSTPELLHILTDEQIKEIVRGLLVYTRTEIAAKITSKQKKEMLSQTVALGDL
jgi:hypothetical protein